MTHALPLAILLGLATLAPSAQAAPPLPEVAVTTCGQVVPKKTLGYLTGNLDCTGFTGGPGNVLPGDEGAAVYVDRKGKLDLRGFTITGGRNGVLCNAIVCVASHPCSKHPCEVFGGTLVGVGTTSRGIGGYRPIVHDVTITGFWIGIYSYTKLQLSNATIQDSGAAGVMGKGLFITNAIITNSGQFGIGANNTAGAVLHLTDSTVTGNGTESFCGAFPCADLYAARQPRLRNSVCNTSLASPSGDWDVCALD